METNLPRVLVTVSESCNSTKQTRMHAHTVYGPVYNDRRRRQEQNDTLHSTHTQTPYKTTVHQFESHTERIPHHLIAHHKQASIETTAVLRLLVLWLVLWSTPGKTNS